ncbi:MAG: hypothetical protein R6V23_00465 [Bacteroidales bacterium]
MKKNICLLFLVFVVLFNSCNNKQEDDLNLKHLDQISKNINQELKHISNDLENLTFSLRYKIPFDQPVEWDQKIYHKNKNLFYYSSFSENASAIYLPGNIKLNTDIKKIIVNSQNLDSIFLNFIKEHVFVNQIYFIDTNSFLRIYPYIDIAKYFTKPINLKNFLPYQKVSHKPLLENKSYWINSPYADPYGRGWIISCVEPVYYRDEFIGILSADITLKTLLSEYFSSASQILLLTDQKGNVICTTRLGCKLLGIPQHREFIYSKPVTENILIYNYPSLSDHQNKNVRNAMDKLLSDKNIADFTLDGKKYTIYKSIMKETNWLLLKIIN